MRAYVHFCPLGEREHAVQMRGTLKPFISCSQANFLAACITSVLTITFYSLVMKPRQSCLADWHIQGHTLDITGSIFGGFLVKVELMLFKFISVPA